MTYKVKKSLDKTITEITEEYGYKSKEAFMEDALEHRILDLKKSRFLSKVGSITDKLKKKGLAEAEILRDFDKFYHTT